MNDMAFQTCGACCINPQMYADGTSYVDLMEKDLRRIARSRRRVSHWTVDGLYRGLAMRAAQRDVLTHHDGRLKTCPAEVCIALKGKAGKRCACAIYDARPDACRSFRPGSEGCLEAREALGLGRVGGARVSEEGG